LIGSDSDCSEGYIEMDAFRPRLMEAETARARMDALCEFLEFWLRPYRSTPAEPYRLSGDYRAPMPLRRLYECAARLADDEHPFLSRAGGYCVEIFTRQDCLVEPGSLPFDEAGRIIFLDENQACWDCRTLPEGEDPPVWCHREMGDKDGVIHVTDEVVSESLSRFLASYALQEIAIGSRHHVRDEALSHRWALERDAANPLWIDGPYVYGSDSNYNFHLWGHVLVADLDGDGRPFFATNHEDGARFIEENLGLVIQVGLGQGRWWYLEMSPDGSARLRYKTWESNESVGAPPATFDYPEIVAGLFAVGVNNYLHEGKIAVRFIHPRGHKDLPDVGLVTSLFGHALERSTGAKEALGRRFAAEWPF